MAALAETVCADPGEAEDIAAEALRRAHDRWDAVGRYERPGAWLRRVTINLAHSHSRRIGTRRRFLSRQRATVAATTIPDSDDELWEAVAQLAPKQRAAIALRYLEDLSTEEIAEVLEIAPSTARNHLHQACKNLALILQEGGRS